MRGPCIICGHRWRLQLRACTIENRGMVAKTGAERTKVSVCNILNNKYFYFLAYIRRAISNREKRCPGGLVVEYSPATRETRVRFPAWTLLTFSFYLSCGHCACKHFNGHQFDELWCCAWSAACLCHPRHPPSSRHRQACTRMYSIATVLPTTCTNSHVIS